MCAREICQRGVAGSTVLCSSVIAPSRRYRNSAQDHIWHELRMVAAQRSQVTQVAAGDENERLIGESGGHAVDDFPDCTDGAPKEAAADRSFRVLADDRRGLVVAR